MAGVAVGTREGTPADAAAIVELQLRELGRDLVRERVEGLLRDFPSLVLEDGSRLVGSRRRRLRVRARDTVLPALRKGARTLVTPTTRHG